MRHEEALGRQALGEVAWHSPCDGGTCVEVALQGEDVLLRSSLAPEVIVALSRAEWRTFLSGAIEGRFDHL